MSSVPATTLPTSVHGLPAQASSVLPGRQKHSETTGAGRVEGQLSGFPGEQIGDTPAGRGQPVASTSCPSSWCSSLYHRSPPPGGEEEREHPGVRCGAAAGSQWVLESESSLSLPTGAMRSLGLCRFPGSPRVPMVSRMAWPGAGWHPPSPAPVCVENEDSCSPSPPLRRPPILKSCFAFPSLAPLGSPKTPFCRAEGSLETK